MQDINIAILDAATLGDDIDFSLFEKIGHTDVYGRTDSRQVRFRIMDADVVIVNKIKLDRSNLQGAKRLKLICVTATGFDNIDVLYCRDNGIAVCNVRGYSTDSVAQVTSAMALSLVNHLSEFDRYVKNMQYTKSGLQNHVKPVFHELSSMTWGIVGLGTIGERVAEIANTFGCSVLAFKRRRDPMYNCVTLEELCKKSDIISIHLPLSDNTRNIINDDMISLMKPNAIVINAARGAVVDEAALTRAVAENRIGGLGVDVYSAEPMAEDSPYIQILDRPNVIFTPHMAWGAYESRVRCMEEIAENIESFFKGKKRNRVEL